MSHSYDAVVVGAGPNGLAAAIEIARAGRNVVVLEADEDVGGGTRTRELTLPGFHHDVCSAFHPLGAGSPFFSALPLGDHGLEWIQPDVPLAHPLDDGSAVLLERAIGDTAAGLGPDATTYLRMLSPVLDKFDDLLPELMRPLRVPRHPIEMLRFAPIAFRSADRIARRFSGEQARALFAGNVAHAFLPFGKLPSGAFGALLMLLAHVVGWPIPKGGSRAIADALAGYLRSLGGEIVTGHRVRTMADLPASRAVLFDLTSRQVLEIAGAELPPRYRRTLRRWRYGPGAFKVDFALDGPVPWKASECERAGCLHLGGSYEEIAAGEAAIARGEHPERPWVIVGQHSRFDATRAPAGKHTLWAYCHVPNGSTVDMTEAITDQIDRFAPGFRELILATNSMGPASLEAHNANLVGGDINGGLQDLRQHIARPSLRFDPYTTPNPRLYLCSSSTPPGGGVHGMCGYHAARTALRRTLA